MDRLARNAMLARQAGMSYGKWKALQPRVEPQKPELSEYERVCAYCGKTFVKKNKQVQIYCELYCRMEAQKERDKQRKDKKKNDKRSV